MKKNTIISILLLTAIALTLWVILLLARKPNYQIKERIFYDTITTTDTVYLTRNVFIDKPTLVKETVLRVDTVDNILHDTIFNVRAIREENKKMLFLKQKVYSDMLDSSRYKAFVSGYGYPYDSFPRLDSISIDVRYPKITDYKTVTIEKVTEKVKKKHWNMGVMAGVGYGVVNKKPDLFVGIGGGYSF